MTTKKKVTKRPPTLRQVLDYIDRILASRSNRKLAANLWDVLAALRGPDNQYSLAKIEGTMRIRSLAFPRTAAPNCVFIRAAFAPSCEARRPIQLEKLNGAGTHFANHIESAAEALGAVVVYKTLDAVPAPVQGPSI